MPKLWEITREEARKWGERLRSRREEADRIARPLFVAQTAEASSGEEPSDSAGAPTQPKTVAILRLVPSDGEHGSMMAALEASVRHPAGGASQRLAKAASASGASTVRGLRVTSYGGGRWDFVPTGELGMLSIRLDLDHDDLANEVALLVTDSSGALKHEVPPQSTSRITFLLEKKIWELLIDLGGSLYIVLKEK
jgi:hypothetical protein